MDETRFAQHHDLKEMLAAILPENILDQIEIVYDENILPKVDRSLIHKCLKDSYRRACDLARLSDESYSVESVTPEDEDKTSVIPICAP